MLKRVIRKPEKSQNWRCFVNRVRYISNQGHAHHSIKKVVLAAVNFWCMWRQGAKDFIEAVHQTQKLWQVRKRKKKGGGNPTKDIFFELIYSAPKGLRTTAKERDAIDKMITAPFQNCPIRRGWHLAAWDLKEAERPKNWKPLDDSHYLISARDNFGKASISTRFGDGRETLESWMRRMDEEICEMLNQTREMQYEPVHTIYRRRLGAKLGVKLTTLHEMIAHHASESVTRDNLADVIEAVMQTKANEAGKEPVAKVTNKNRSLDDDKLVWVHFTGRKQARKYRIEKLLLNIAEAQLDIELSRPTGNEDREGGTGGVSGSGAGSLKRIDQQQADMTSAEQIKSKQLDSHSHAPVTLDGPEMSEPCHANKDSDKNNRDKDSLAKPLQVNSEQDQAAILAALSKKDRERRKKNRELREQRQDKDQQMEM